MLKSSFAIFETFGSGFGNNYDRLSVCSNETKAGVAAVSNSTCIPSISSWGRCSILMLYIEDFRTCGVKDFIFIVVLDFISPVLWFGSP
jgi:hypothetical protein